MSLVVLPAAGEGAGCGKNPVVDFLEPQSPPSAPSQNCSHKSRLPLTESACLLSLPSPALPSRPGKGDGREPGCSSRCFGVQCQAVSFDPTD